MNIELIECWVRCNAPDEISDDLIEGIKDLYCKRIRDKNYADRFPNDGKLFTKEECEKIAALKGSYGYGLFTCEEDRQMERDFGRPAKSIKNKIKRMNKVNN